MIAAITKEDVLQINFDKESENGNIEYKWRLINISPERQVHLTTQMKYRLDVRQLI
jgi:GTPase